jgi:hypothetical protein
MAEDADDRFLQSVTSLYTADLFVKVADIQQNADLAIVRGTADKFLRKHASNNAKVGYKGTWGFSASTRTQNFSLHSLNTQNSKENFSLRNSLSSMSSMSNRSSMISISRSRSTVEAGEEAAAAEAAEAEAEAGVV